MSCFSSVCITARISISSSLLIFSFLAKYSRRFFNEPLKSVLRVSSMNPSTYCSLLMRGRNTLALPRLCAPTIFLLVSTCITVSMVVYAGLGSGIRSIISFTVACPMSHRIFMARSSAFVSVFCFVSPLIIRLFCYLLRQR